MDQVDYEAWKQNLGGSGIIQFLTPQHLAQSQLYRLAKPKNFLDSCLL